MQQLDAARARTVRLRSARLPLRGAAARPVRLGRHAGIDTERLAESMLDHGWLLAPGALFHATPRPSTLMRINFATTQDHAFWRDLQRTCRHMSGG